MRKYRLKFRLFHVLDLRSICLSLMRSICWCNEKYLMPPSEDPKKRAIDFFLFDFDLVNTKNVLLGDEIDVLSRRTCLFIWDFNQISQSIYVFRKNFDIIPLEIFLRALFEKINPLTSIYEWNVTYEMINRRQMSSLMSTLSLSLSLPADQIS